jgi:pyridoxal phosphate enzyme (YggS family)
MIAENALIRTNIERVCETIARVAQRAGRRAEEITLVAVSKTFPAESIRAAFDAGLRHFGENRVQEWEAKQPHLADLTATWHLIGHLQSNKARRAAHLFNRVDSVDSLSLAQKLDAAASEEAKKLPVLIEVHLSDEATKSGVGEPDLAPLAEKILALPHLDLLGLMTIPPFFDDAKQVRPHFAQLRELHARLQAALGKSLPALSMGMSHDFEIAIEEGATEIRVGSALFGQRSTKV